MKKLLIPIVLVLALFIVGAAGAQSPVTAVVTANGGDGVTVGDPIALTIAVTHPAGYTVIAPDLPEQWGEFVVVGMETAVVNDNGNGTETTSIPVDARLFAPGAFVTPPLDISVTDGAGQLTSATALPASVTVNSVLTEGDTELRDIKPQLELPIPSYLAWILLGATILIAAAAYTFWRRRQARLALAAVDNRLPHEVALDELERVRRLGLPEVGQFKEHYTLVTDTVRLYLEKRYEIPMTERTTDEIQAEMKQSRISEAVSRQIVNFLDDSDLVKFSTFTPDVPSAYQLLNHGRLIVEATKQEPVIEESTPIPPSTPDFKSLHSSNGSAKPIEAAL